MKKYINRILFISILLLSLVLFFVDIPLLSPFSENSFSSFLSGEKKLLHKKVYGFLPYWNVKEVTIQPELTHLAYFALNINQDGSLKTQEDQGFDPGFYQLQSDEFLDIQNILRNQKKPLEIVLTQFKNEEIEAFLSSDEAQANFFQSLDSLLLAYPFSGINIDIEYMGDASPEVRAQYLQYIKNLRTHLQSKYTHIQLSIDMYAAAAEKNMIWDVSNLHPYVDNIIVMAYDFHRSSSPQAGPVAPLFMKENSWQESIHTYLQSFTQKVPSEKILLGVPFYGYEWQTTTLEAQSSTYPKSGATASYKRVQELLARREELQIKEFWDEQALEPYFTYIQDGKFYTVYYENKKSLQYKLDYVEQMDLGGIAIWSLGYEGDSREFWDVIQDKILPE